MDLLQYNIIIEVRQAAAGIQYTEPTLKSLCQLPCQIVLPAFSVIDSVIIVAFFFFRRFCSTFNQNLNVIKSVIRGKLLPSNTLGPGTFTDTVSH